MKTVTASTARSMTWAQDAACASEAPDLFFPIGVSGPPEHVAKAKEICAHCPVNAQCLAYALETKQQHGIWGGLTEEERRSRLRSDQRRRAASSRPAHHRSR